MGTKETLDIYEILKENAPSGIRLWSPIVGDCALKGFRVCKKIIVEFTDENGDVSEWTFKSNGYIASAFRASSAYICLFPSKEMRDWSKFIWKKGDVLTDNTSTICMFDSWANEDYTEFNAKYALHSIVSTNAENEVCKTNDFVPVLKDIDKQIYLVATEKIFNVNLTEGSLKIEKPKPEFKDGDIVAFNNSIAICRHISEHTIYFYACISETWGLMINDNSVSRSYRLATDSEKQLLFDALAKEGKKWNPDTLQIEDVKEEYEFKPFDRVLVRDEHNDYWQVSLFSCRNIHKKSEYRFCCVGEVWKQCIPYNDQTSHLLGTNGEWKGGEV